MKSWERRALKMGAVLIGIGVLAFVGVLAANNFDFSSFVQGASLVRREVKPEGAFDRVEVRDASADVLLLPSEDGTCSVHCDEDGRGAYVVEVRDGTLRIRKETKWYENILNFNFVRTEVAVRLPEAAYRSLAVQTASGSIRIEGLNAEEIDARTASGGIRIADLDAERISAHSVSGGVQLSALRAEALDAGSTSGGVALSDCIASGGVQIRTVSGGIRVDAADAASFELSSVSGSIRGSLNSAKDFDVHSVSGRIAVPNSVATGGSFSASTTSGSIEISTGS